MSFSARCSAVLLVTTLLLSVGIPLRLAASEAYRKNCLPLKCFVKDFCAVDDSFMAISKNKKAQDFERVDKDPKVAQEFLNMGKSFYEKYQGTFDTLLNNAEAILAEPLPLFTEKQVEAIRTSKKVIDYRFCREMARLFKTVAYHLYKSGKTREATDMLRLCFRFGQIISAGDGEPPNLIQGVIGYAIQNTALENLPATILHSNTLPADYLDAVSTSFTKMEAEKTHIETYFKTEYAYLINTIQHEFDAWIDPKDEVLSLLVKQIGSIKNLDKKKVQEVWVRRLTNIQSQMINMYLRNIENPRGFRAEVSSFSRELSQKANVGTMNAMIDPIEKSADTVASLSFVNFGKVYEDLLMSRYKALGAMVLFKVAASMKNGGALPKTADELKKILGKALPIDLFSDKKEPCVFKNDNGEIILYSVGTNGHDDGGNGEHDKDMILFRY
ncbi:MAG: hypothetical protein WA705_03715 [Candidatus Ozemobacteraceae bacterium]